MLRLMRQQAGSWLIKILLGAIVIVFIFWGVGSFRAQRGGRVALVNGDQITLDEYREAYNNLLEQLRERFGNNLNEDMIKMLQVRKQALNQLVDNKLLVQEAKRLKFRVSDKELAEAIMKIGAFQRAGVFDSRLYSNVLDRLRMTPEEFEIAQREAVLIERLRTIITGGVKVADQEVVIGLRPIFSVPPSLETWIYLNRLSSAVMVTLYESDWTISTSKAWPASTRVKPVKSNI